MTQDISKLSFEEALNELETIVRRLEEGTSSLEESLKDYERGSALRLHCEAKLKEAQTKVEKIILAKDGTVALESATIG